MGVPLEEMDVVFGEGKPSFSKYWLSIHNHYAEELETQLDNESERASLISRPSHHGSSRGWVSRVMGRKSTRSTYEPIADAEE